MFIRESSNLKYKSGTLLSDITDHFTNFIFLQRHSRNKQLSKNVTFRLYSQGSIEAFKGELETTDWQNVLEKQDVDEAYDLFIKKYTEALENQIPYKTFKFNKYKLKKHTWITRGILNSMKTRDKLHKKVLKQSDRLHAQHLINYRKYRNILNLVIRRAKMMHWNDKFINCRNNMKMTWQNINNVLHRVNNKMDFPKYFIHENSHIEKDCHIADTFNSFYTSIGPNLAEKIPNGNTTAQSYLPQLNIQRSFFLNPTDTREVKSAFLKLKPKLSSGHDNLTSKLMTYHSYN
jgi:hypothetical protein